MRRPSTKSSTKINTSRHSGKGQLRIIAGKWRGRKLPIPDIEGLRPTPDRIRETIFNWLAGVINGAECLDLYCGSGALGFEAASRGAKHTKLVDVNTKAITQITANIKTLDATAVSYQQMNVLDYLENDTSKKDLVFIDPPFNKNLIAPTLEKLETNGWLKRNSYIYIETESNLVELNVPSNWVLHREKKTGQVLSRLYIRNS